jgi:hypothetical protein
MTSIRQCLRFDPAHSPDTPSMTVEQFSPEPTIPCQADPKECAIVYTGQFRCLAFLNETGWHDAYHPDGPPLKVLRIELLGS